jgi:hypothetical protein
MFGEAQCRTFSRGEAGDVSRMLAPVYFKLRYCQTDAPRSRRETFETVETNKTLLEWSENITKQIEDEKARGFSQCLYVVADS